MAQLPGMPSWGQGWLDAYLAQADLGDIVRGDVGRGARWWHHLFDGVATLTEGRLQRLQDRVGRQVDEIGTAFRLPGDAVERRWQSSALPLLIGEDEWQKIAAGVRQRADLMEQVLGDLYGPADLVKSGALPATLATGSSHFWRAMIDLPPPGGHHLHIYAVDLARGPDGEWRVLADHTRTPIGAGYALENRLASSRVMGALQTRLNIQRLAPFFAAFREGLAASCRRANPRIGLLTPGRYNPSYAEQAHLARYLGLLLVEGDDLAVRGDELFVRTIEGLKRIDGLWRRIDTRFLDPLAFDAGSRIGVPGLMDVFAKGNAMIANAPGAGVAESPAMAAFLPLLARRLLGEELKLPNIATWWCGQEGPCAEMVAQLDALLITPAFGRDLPGVPASGVLASNLNFADREALVAAIARRPQDYVGQEVVQLSTMPVVSNGRVTPRPFILRAFAARDARGNWEVMPGGFARIGEELDLRATVMGGGAFSADVGIVALGPVEPVSLLPAHVAVRRNPGTLPSRAADNLFWLGRYIERADATTRLVRATLGGTLDADGGASLVPMTLDRLATLLISTGAAKLGSNDDEDEEEDEPEGSIRDLAELAEAALDGMGLASVRSLFATAHNIAEVIRERLAADVWRLIDMPLPGPASAALEDAGALLDRAAVVQERCSALAGLAAENMGRTAGWRFHDLGRRIERALSTCRLVRSFAAENASADDLTTLLDLGDAQISYRARYLAGVALVPVRDLVALDPFNPRSIAFQVSVIREHLAALPTLRDDGIAEDQVALAQEITLMLTTTRAELMSPTGVLALENRLMALSDSIGKRYFLQVFGYAARAGHDARLMRYSVRHQTRFDYAFPVRFARCNLRLHPADWDGQRVEEYRLSVDPAGQLTPGRDSGYLAITDRLLVDRPSKKLVIESHSIVVVEREAPVAQADDCTVEQAAALAMEERALDRMAPANFLFPSPLIAAFPEIAAWCAAELRPERGIVEAGLALARAIRAAFKYDGSATELDTSPGDAFAAKRGVCQDFAQIMISGARSAGLAAAYVSGYLRTVPPPGKERLVGADATHAWAMIWCGPTRGWIGFDPTNGVTVGSDHIICAIGRDYADVSPIDGIFLGRDGQKIEVAVDVEPLIEAEVQARTG